MRWKAVRASAAGPAARNARRVPEMERECPSAHRSSDGDRPARYRKVGGAAKLDLRVHQARCRLRKSECSRVGSSFIMNGESDELGGVGWGIRKQPDRNGEAPWIAGASPAADEERCPVQVDAGCCTPTIPGVQPSSGGAPCGPNDDKPAAVPMGVHVGRACWWCRVRSARPTADEDDKSAQH